MTRGRRREHYQWNMDIWGVAGVEAEAELLAAVVTFFDRVGLGPQDVGIKVRTPEFADMTSEAVLERTLCCYCRSRWMCFEQSLTTLGIGRARAELYAAHK